MSRTTISTARVIEIGSVTAGIAVPDGGGFRFFSSQHPFASLDGRRFRSLKHATAAANAKWRRNVSPDTRPSRTEAEDFVLRPDASGARSFPAGPLTGRYS